MSNTAASPVSLEISSRELFERIQRGDTVDLIDVRSRVEYQSVHAAPARFVAIESLDLVAFNASRGQRKDEPLYVICASGGRSRVACNRFRAAGMLNVVNVKDGTSGWERAGLPVIRGSRKVIAMDRQVRITAGSFVLVGTVLGAFVHPWFLGLSGFIGAGLVFSGVTDTCGMAFLLAKMPWNRRVG